MLNANTEYEARRQEEYKYKEIGDRRIHGVINYNKGAMDGYF